MLRFYTLPPNGVQYPFLLTHLRNAKQLTRRRFEHAIVDSGVMIFVNANCKEYPRAFLDQYAWRCHQLNEILHGKAYFVIADYPDDYNPGQFGDNVSKTIENIKRFLPEDGVEWMPVIQARFLDYLNFFDSCQRTQDVIGKDYPRVGLGTVCKCENTPYIEYCCRVARQFFPRSWIHAFGVTLRALPKIKDVIDSYDSMAWTKPRRGNMGLPSCRNKAERIKYFDAYLRRLKEILN